MINKIKKNKQIIAWSMYDFANQPFTTLIVTFIFSAFFTESLAQDNQQGTYLWSLGISITAILVAFFSPLLGAIADSGGYRKAFLVFFTYLCIISTIILYFFEPNKSYVIFGADIDVSICALFVFIIANIGFEFGTVFCNSYLSDLSTNKNIGRISGFAWGLGFVGGLISLAVSFLFLDLNVTENIRLINLLVAFWFIVFSFPTFLLVRDQKPKKGMRQHFQQSLKSIVYSFQNISKHKSIVRFLVARLFYNDALITIFAFGGIYAAGTLNFSFNEILILGVVLNISACIGSFWFGFVEDKIGVKQMLNMTLWGLLLSTFLAFLAPFLTNYDHLITPKTLFWIAGIIIGLMQGPNQAGSRSLMARLTPEEKKNEFFGFYAFSGKATAFLGPLLFGLVTQKCQDGCMISQDFIIGGQQAGLIVVVFLFLFGILIFRPLNLTNSSFDKK
ncbi:MAG: MFS transporter [Flavobacteriales bacterium]|nr:MFS transporter [Flavobacteriales bacterium]|tara:strand:+ start:5944 stop:7284 length:1341 start_codon:yes stop_codon:yes gene_type:complete